MRMRHFAPRWATLAGSILGLVAGSLAQPAWGCVHSAAGASSLVTPHEFSSQSPATPLSRRNLEDFDFVVAKVAENYAGWEAKTAGPCRAELDALTARLRQQVATGDDTAARAAIEQWVAWFNDGHLRIDWTAADERSSRTFPLRRRNAADARATLTRQGDRLRLIEGLWAIDDQYELAVVRQDEGANVYYAIVLSSVAETWSPGDVKAVLTERADGSFLVRYGMSDRTEIFARGQLVSRNEVLEIAGLGFWRRKNDDPAEAEAARHRWPDDSFAITRIAADTLYLRLPSFNDAHTQTVRELIEAWAGELAATPHLIIDVRGNGGGSDFVYDPVLPLIYTRPIWRLGVEVRVSPDNERLRREVGERLATVSPDVSRALLEESDRMARTTEPFIRREPPVEVVRLNGPLANPAKVVLLIDRAGSSAENFIIDARQSRKVTLMGQENSAGVIDYGEMMTTAAPSGRFALLWATTRSLRLPGDPVDPHGIAPDVTIPEGVADPVRWASERLRRH